MNSFSKIVVSLFNFFILLWLIFAFQRILEIGIDIKYLNVIISAITSAFLTYLVWKQHLNFGTVFKWSGIFWVVGFVLGLVYVSIFDPNEAQGIFLSILWTAHLLVG